MGNSDTIGLVIVNYMKAARTVECIQALRRQTIYTRCRLCVVDNSVSSAEAQLLRDALGGDEMLIVSEANVGYTKGANAGAKALGPKMRILLISPDIIADDCTTIEKLEAVMSADATIGVLATLQHNDDGSIPEVARKFPTGPGQVLRRIWPDRFSEVSLQAPLRCGGSGTIDVDWVQSSFVMIDGGFWWRIGGLDERYFIFMADVALCRRAHQSGLRVVVTQSVDARADGIRASSGGLLTFFKSRVLRIHLRDALVYYLSF